jgi:anti-sigma factor RsiW
MTTETRETPHEALNDELNAYLDGQLDAARRGEVERHLGECALCRADLHDLEAARGLLRSQPLRRAPRTFAIPAVPAVPAVEAAPSRWLGLFAWGWRLGSFATAACVALALYTSRGGPAPYTQPSGSSAGAGLAQKAAPAAPAAQVPNAAEARDQAQSAAPRAAAPAASPAAIPPAAASGALTSLGAGAPAAVASPAATVVSTPPAAPPQVRPDVTAPRTAERSPLAPAWTVWAAAALAIGVGSALLFTLERRARAA